jgi:Spy/CpxP family protein refolding chaperone
LPTTILESIVKHRHITRAVIAATTVIAIGLAVNAFAGWGIGEGQGHHMRGYQGGSYGPGGGGLSQGQYQEMDAAQKKFYQETEALRNGMYQKQLALEAELARDKVDTNKASQLQKDLSKIRADMDQKRIAYMAEMKKINPDAGRGYGRGMGARGGPHDYGGGPCGH